MSLCTRINITINEDLLSKLDKYADSVSLSRSGAIAMIVSQYLNAQATVSTLQEAMEIYRREQERKGTPI